MEHGHYYEVLAQQFSAAGLFVSAVNPKLVKNFNNDSLRKVKSDKADSIKIAHMLLTNGKILNHSIVDELRTIKGHESSVSFLCETQKTAMKK